MVAHATVRTGKNHRDEVQRRHQQDLEFVRVKINSVGALQRHRNLWLVARLAGKKRDMERESARIAQIMKTKGWGFRPSQVKEVLESM